MQNERGCVAYIVRIDRERELIPGQVPFSPSASLRLRVLIPGSELARLLTVKLVPFEQFLESPRMTHLGTIRAAVIGKLSVIEVEKLRSLRDSLFKAISSCAFPVFADFSDNYAAAGRSPALAEYQMEMAKRTTLTVPCEALAEQLRAVATRGVHVIEDPFESPELQAAFEPSADEIRLCWFGASYTGSLLEAAFSKIAEANRHRRVRLNFVTAPGHETYAKRLGLRLAAIHSGFDTRFVLWSPENVARALQDSDLAVLPQDSSTEWGRGKSHNRLVHAIRCGRFTVASAIPSYVELADFAQIDDDLATGVCWAMDNPQLAIAKLRAGQAHVRDRFAPERIALRWAELLGVNRAST